MKRIKSCTYYKSTSHSVLLPVGDSTRDARMEEVRTKAQHRSSFQLLEFFSGLLNWGCSNHSWCHLITVQGFVHPTDPQSCGEQKSPAVLVLQVMCHTGQHTHWVITLGNMEPGAGAGSTIYRRTPEEFRHGSGSKQRQTTSLAPPTKKRQKKCC